MKRIIVSLSCAAALVLGGCNKYLDRQPLDSPTSETFLVNEEEMNLGLNGVYGSALWVQPNYTPLLFAIESTTDLAIRRTGNAEDQIALGDAGPFLVTNALVSQSYNQAYKLVSRASIFLDGMQRGKANVSPTTFGRLEAEALVLRAWAYYHLMGWFGDVVYYRTLPTAEGYFTQKRTPVAQIVPELIADLDKAAAAFDAAGTQPVQAMGRVNKGVAMGLKAKLAMLVKDWATAATATKAIIDGNQYALNPSYPNLFLLAGQQANAGREIMFNQTYPTDVLDPQNWLAVITIPRQVGTSQSSHFPSQALVDRYEARDGQRIDQSTVYNDTFPRLNRDNRLRWTVYMPGDTMVHNTAKSPSLPYVQPKERTVFNVHSNHRIKFNWNTNRFDSLASNIDWIGFLNSPWFAGATGNSGGVGYVWRKYVDSNQYSWETKTGYILMRYAEILLNYAEAKIELNQIDGTVLSAINAVRARAGQPPAMMGSQAQMRQLVRRERAVEFAGEGLRLFDLRRWGIQTQAINGPVVGVSLDRALPAAKPSFDDNDIPNYSASVPRRLKTRGQTRAQTARHTLWPIPQGEIDKSPGIVQNPGW